MSKLAKNPISKSSIISKVFLEKIVEFLLYYQIFGLKATFLLILFLNYCFKKKQGGKKNLIWPISLSNFAIILRLLAKIIAVEM